MILSVLKCHLDLVHNHLSNFNAAITGIKQKHNFEHEINN